MLTTEDTKKTIFLTIGTGIVARNFLNNVFYKKLKEHYRVVLFTPLHDDADFRERFGGPAVSFEPLIHHRLTRSELIIIALHKALMYNESVKIKSFYSISSTMRQQRTFRKKLKNYFEFIVFGLFLSKCPILRGWLKVLDRALFRAEYYRDVYDRYKPDLVFITNIGSDDEVYLLRSAIRRKIPNAGMTKSWDNFSKVGFREWVNTLVVWSEYMKEEAAQFQRYPPRHIVVVGLPQFDVLAEVKKTHTREDFLHTYGLDPNKKTILFGQSNPLTNPDDVYIAGVIKDWIVATDAPYQMLIRPHFRHKDAEKPFLPLVDDVRVFIDLLNNPSHFANGAWDLSEESQVRRALSLCFSDVVVNATSTLVLDTAVVGTPFIAYAFDRHKDQPYATSIRRIFDLLWYIDLKKHGFGELMVYDKEELIERIGEILSRGRDFSGAYGSIITRFCHKSDGKAGERLYTIIDGLLRGQEVKTTCGVG